MIEPDEFNRAVAQALQINAEAPGVTMHHHLNAEVRAAMCGLLFLSLIRKHPECLALLLLVGGPIHNLVWKTATLAYLIGHNRGSEGRLAFDETHEQALAYEGGTNALADLMGHLKPTVEGGEREDA